MDRITCPNCEYWSDDEKDFEKRLPPVNPAADSYDVDDTMFCCPECGFEEKKHLRDPRDQWDTWAEHRGEV